MDVNVTQYLIGISGWAYFKVLNKSSLKTYSNIVNFVEVNHTFQQYQNTRIVEKWRKSVPDKFTFTVQRHQDQRISQSFILSMHCLNWSCENWWITQSCILKLRLMTWRT